MIALIIIIFCVLGIIWQFVAAFIETKKDIDMCKCGSKKGKGGKK